jgi:hypothetical protein
MKSGSGSRAKDFKTDYTGSWIPALVHDLRTVSMRNLHGPCRHAQTRALYDLLGYPITHGPCTIFMVQGLLHMDHEL